MRLNSDIRHCYQKVARYEKIDITERDHVRKNIQNACFDGWEEVIISYRVMHRVILLTEISAIFATSKYIVKKATFIDIR